MRRWRSCGDLREFVLLSTEPPMQQHKLNDAHRPRPASSSKPSVNIIHSGSSLSKKQQTTDPTNQLCVRLDPFAHQPARGGGGGKFDPQIAQRDRVPHGAPFHAKGHCSAVGNTRIKSKRGIWGGRCSRRLPLLLKSHPLPDRAAA